MAITRHQRVHGYLWHWKTGPGWCRDGASIRKLREAGMRVLKVQLQDDGKVDEHGHPLPEWQPIPRDQVDEWRIDGGVQVDGMYWPAGKPLTDGGDWNPAEAAQWLRSERVRLALAGLDCNHEDNVRRLDIDMQGQWSNLFAVHLRGLCPNLPLGFDSYKGAAAGGINIGAYKDKGFRYFIQTFWGGEGLWDDPTTKIVEWCAGAQPTIPKSIVKPIFRVAPNNAGELPNWDTVFANTRLAGTKGCGFYYIDGCPDFDLLLWLIKRAIREGVAY